VRPSGAKATELTQLECPMKVRIDRSYSSRQSPEPRSRLQLYHGGAAYRYEADPRAQPL
jgi:hypothetical protein